MNPRLPPAPLRWPSDELPKVRFASRFAHDDRDFGRTYLLPEHHALHVYDYPCMIRVGRREYRIRPGDLTITPCGVPSMYDLPQPGYHWCIHFFVAERRTGVRLPTHKSLGDRLAFVLERMRSISRLHAQAHYDAVAAAAASATLLELLLWLAMNQSQEHATGVGETRADRGVVEVADLIEQQLDRPHAVPDLARQVGLSQNYLARRFRQRFGVTIPNYLLRRRIELAKQLLRSTDLTIGTIARRIGLDDPHHFNKQFRRLTDLSPTAWRRANM